MHSAHIAGMEYAAAASHVGIAMQIAAVLQIMGNTAVWTDWTQVADISYRISYTVSSCYTDIGLRVYDGTAIRSIAAEPQGTLTSPLRISKNGITYGIVLVDPSDPSATKIKIQTASGTKALRKLD